MNSHQERNVNMKGKCDPAKNAGRKWTADEKATIISRIRSGLKSGMTMTRLCLELAEEYGRTKKAIKTVYDRR